MKILVYGVGVIGSYLVHVLCTAKNDVTVIARGKHKEVLESHGLEIYHHLQHKTTNDKIHVIDHIDGDMNFDAVFAVMPFHKMKAVLTPLSEVRSPIVILVGNNLEPAQMADYIEKNSVVTKEVLFGF